MIEQLPTEILQMILDESLPEDLVNFSLTSRLIYFQARQHLAQHQRLKARFSRVACGHGFPASVNVTNQTSLDHGLAVLMTIHTDRRVPYYIRSLNVASKTRDRENISALMKGEDIDTCRALWDGAPADLNFSDVLHLGSESSALAALLPFCYSLRELKIAAAYGYDEWSHITNTVRRILRASSDLDSSARALTHIQTVTIENTDLRTPLSLNVILPFLALPSISYLKCIGFDGWESHIHKPEPLLQAKRAVFTLNTLQIESCGQSSASLSWMLSRCPRLTNFTYRCHRSRTSLPPSIAAAIIERFNQAPCTSAVAEIRLRRHHIEQGVSAFPSSSSSAMFHSFSCGKCFNTIFPEDHNA